MDYGRRLADLLLDAPRGCAEQASVTLRGLAASGAVEAAGALALSLARTLDLAAEPDEAFLKADSFDTLLADDRIPALLRVYAASYATRALVANFERLRELAAEVSAGNDISAFARAVAAKSVLADEALRAYVTCAFIHHAAVQARFQPELGTALFGEVLNVIGRSCRLVDGGNVDMRLQVGREAVAQCGDLQSFFSILYHEFGHYTFDAARREAIPTVSGSLFSGATTTLVIDERYERLVAALPGAWSAARAGGALSFTPDDARAIRLSSGARIVMSCSVNGPAAYSHVCVSQAGGAIDLREAAAYAFVISRVLGVDLAAVACIYPQSGIFHLEFAGHGPDDTELTARVAALDRAALTSALALESEAWIDDLERRGRFGKDEADLKRALGVVPNAIIVYGSQNAIADSDRCLELHTGHVKEIERDQFAGYRDAAVRFADPAVLAGLIESGAAAGIAPTSTRADVWKNLGTSVCVAQSPTSTQFVGPFISAIFAVISELARSGTDVDASLDDAGRNMLHDAATRSIALTRVLLDAGADINHPDAAGRTALGYAVAYAPIAIVELLLTRDASLTRADKRGDTPLHVAVSRGDAAIVNALLQRNADVRARNGAGETPIMQARSERVYDLLRAAGAPIDTARADGTTPLIAAARRGDVAIACRLLAQGADAGAADDHGATAVHFAAMWLGGDQQRVLLDALLDAGADVDEETNDGLTPLLIAARSASRDAVTLLLARGATLDHRARDGESALLLAADGRSQFGRDYSRCTRMLATAELLLERGSDPNPADRDGWTPLMVAARGYYVPLVTLLLERGATATLAASDGTTALHCAAAHGGAAMCEALIAAGALVNAVDDAGNTPLSLARNDPGSGAPATIDLLVAHGATENVAAVS